MEKKEGYINRTVYYLISLFSIILFLSSISAHEEGESFLNNCEKKINPYSKRAKPLKQLPPIYPRLGLINGLEANLLIEFTINKNGEVEDPYVVWQDQTGEYRGKDVFSKNALISVKKYKYEPKKNSDGEIVTSIERVIVTFRIEGREDDLAISNKRFLKILKKYKISRSIKKREKSISYLEQVIRDIDLELAEENLIKIEKAAYLYLKALVLMSLEASTETIITVLLASKENYEFEKIETLKGGVVVRSVTSEKLASFGALLLADSYFKKNDYKNVEHELVHFYNSGKKSNVVRKRFYGSWLQLGVASYTLNNWCNAFQALSTAKSISEKTGLTFPSYLEEPLKYASSQVE